MTTLVSPILDVSLWASSPAGFRKAPFPAFGGKSRVAGAVWARIDGVPGSLGYDPVRNAIEPFCFSAAWLWKRPIVGAIETVNDRNAFVANFWRAVRADPDAVAHHADWPVIETDLHARHQWLVGSDTAAAALVRVREDRRLTTRGSPGGGAGGRAAGSGAAGVMKYRATVPGRAGRTSGRTAAATG